MKNRIFFLRRSPLRANLLGLLCAAMLAGFVIFFPGTELFAQSEENSLNEPPTGLQIYQDENGNNVMRTTPAPLGYNEQGNDTFYIAPQIYPEMWGKDFRLGWNPPHPGPGPYPRPGEHFGPGENFGPGGGLGPLHPGATPHH